VDALATALAGTNLQVGTERSDYYFIQVRPMA
jgi:hypothetical protein